MENEIYVLATTRSLPCIESFLETFLPNRALSADELPIPELTDFPDRVLRTEREILVHLTEHKSETYGLYFNNLVNRPEARQAMLFFTRDGGLILGLAIVSTLTSKYLKLLKQFTGSKCALVTVDERPPETISEFLATCSSRASNRPLR